MILLDGNDPDVDLEADTGGRHEGMRRPPTLVDLRDRVLEKGVVIDVQDSIAVDLMGDERLPRTSHGWNVSASPHDPGGTGLPDPQSRLAEYLAGDPWSEDHGTSERNDGSGREEAES